MACVRPSVRDDRLGLTFNCGRFITHPFIEGIVPPFSIQMSLINLGKDKLTNALYLIFTILVSFLLSINFRSCEIENLKRTCDNPNIV